MSTTRYCLGFMFSEEVHTPKIRQPVVVLIRKNKPKWQEGHLNGVGGKVEANEYPIYAMVREFEEETGVKTITDDWTHFGAMMPEIGDAWIVELFYAVDNVHACKTMEDEEIVICGCGALEHTDAGWMDDRGQKVVASIRPAISAAISRIRYREPGHIEMRFNLMPPSDTTR